VAHCDATHSGVMRLCKTSYGGREKMNQQQTGGQVYVALVLATLAAIISVTHPAVPRDPARFLLLTCAPEAAAAAGAIGEDADTAAPF
jgi:hypothetical protein